MSDQTPGSGPGNPYPYTGASHPGYPRSASHPGYRPSANLPTPSPRPSSGRGGGWMIFAVVLLCLLAISVILNLGLGMSAMSSGLTSGVKSGKHAHDQLEEVVIEDNNASDKIVVIDVGGVISSQALTPDGMTLADLIEAQLDRAGHDRRVKGVILRVDSPGGEVMASDEISKMIREFQTGEHGKPVIVSMGNLAASGGYYIAAPGRWIVAHDLTMTGSIGVIMHGYNYRGLMDKLGVRPQVFKSGKFKDMLSGEKLPSEELPEEAAMMQGMIGEMYDRFKKVVSEGRSKAAADNANEGRKLDPNWTEYADGRILSGKTAYEHGFVDELGDFEVAIDRALKIAELESANLVSYQLRFHFGNLLRFLGESKMKSTGQVKVDLGLDFPKLQAGRPYYIVPTLVP